MTTRLDVAELLERASTGQVENVNQLLEESTIVAGDVQNTLINCRDTQGKTALWLAVEREDITAVKTLVQAGADVNLTYRSLQTVLMLAADKGHTEILKFLLESKADLDSVDAFGMSAAMVAVEKNNLECLNNLIVYGACLSKKDIRGKTAVLIAIENAHWKCLQHLIRAGTDYHSQDEGGRTPLMTAVGLGNLECVQSLVQWDASVNAQDRQGWSALHMSAKHSPQCLRILLERTDVNVDLQDRKGNTPLILAAENGNVGSLQLLVSSGAQLDIRNTAGWSALMVAAVGDHVSCVEYLVGTGANVSMTLKDGKTALMLAAVKGHAACMQVLLNGDHGCVDMECDSKKTALIYAAENYNVNCMRTLVGFGTDIKTRDARGRTPVMCLIFQTMKDNVFMYSCHRHEKVKHCVHALQDLNALVVDAQDKDGKTALMLACQERSLAEIVQMLITAGADIEHCDNRGKSALIHASDGGNLEAMKHLVNAGASVNICDVHGCTPLHYLSRRKMEPKIHACIRYLLLHHADVNALDKDGKTCLMYAMVDTDIREALDIMLDYGALVNLTDRFRGSALAYAIGHSDHNLEKTRVLLNHGADPNIGRIRGRCALSLAICNRSYDITELLLNSITEPKIDWAALNHLITCNEKKMFHLLIKHGAFPIIEHSEDPYEFNHPLKHSILGKALELGRENFARFFFVLGFLNKNDVTSRLNLNSGQSRIVTGNRPMFRMRQTVRYQPARDLCREMYSQPWPLVKLCFVLVSSYIGFQSGRTERVRRTQLPPRLQRMLMFQDRLTNLCPFQWDTIPLCLDPNVYETLPKPRPLLYYWPFGRELVECNCELCGPDGLKFH